MSRANTLGATAAPYSADARATILRLFDLLEDEESRSVLLGKIRYYLSLNKTCLDDIRSSAQIYFDPTIVPKRPDHIVVDGGAFDGDTLRQFRQFSADSFRKYHAFEPDALAFARLQKEADADDRIELVCAGLSRQTGILRFSSTGMADGTVAFEDDPAASVVNVVALDSYFTNRTAPTIIKMDIEGSEADALEGARQLISRHRPVLAVSVYHHPADLWEIPILMTELASNYRFHLRHYTREIDDTVCYAIPQ